MSPLGMVRSAATDVVWAGAFEHLDSVAPASPGNRGERSSLPHGLNLHEVISLPNFPPKTTVSPSLYLN